MKYRLCMVLFMVGMLLAFRGMTAETDTASDRIIGLWATDKAEAHVEIRREDDNTYTGTIIWLKDPFYAEDDDAGMEGEPKMDRNNPQANLRERPIIGLQIMKGFVYDGDDRWVDGEIYDPDNGSTYRCKMWLTNEGTLKVRGYVGISLFGRTTEWTPVLGSPAMSEDVQSSSADAAEAEIPANEENAGDE